MKTFRVPEPINCSKVLAPEGRIAFAAFVRELVFPRKAWRDRGNAPLLLEVARALEDAREGHELKLSDEAHELLCAELAMHDIQVNWQLAPVIAHFQIAVQAATPAEPLQ